MSKVALITGITGQDGSYLAEYLLHLGYEVHGLVRNTTSRLESIEHIRTKISLQFGDITSGTAIAQLIADEQYDEIYNLAAQSHVGVSFNIPESTFQTNAVGVLNILEAIRRFSDKTKFYQASTSELFGDYPNQVRMLGGCNENTLMQPTSPYAIAKHAAHQLVKLYRDAYGLYAVAGILFNHESPRRSPSFVTRKITKTLAEIKYGKGIVYNLVLGNTRSSRDWGFAPEYVQVMHRMLQQPNNYTQDFVIGTGITHSVDEFLSSALDYYYLPRNVVETSKSEFRPSDVNYLKADASNAETYLGWKPKVTFEELVNLMCAADSWRMDTYLELLDRYGVEKYWQGY